MYRSCKRTFNTNWKTWVISGDKSWTMCVWGSNTTSNLSEWGALASAASDGMDFVLGNGSDEGWNQTQQTQEGETPDLYNYWAWSIVDGALMVLILSGNTLTILAVTLSRRLSCLVSNQFVLNLAISDLMVGLTLPYHLVFYLDAEFGKIKWSCLMRFILIILACLASIYNIIAIAVDRYAYNILLFWTKRA